MKIELDGGGEKNYQTTIRRIDPCIASLSQSTVHRQRCSLPPAALSSGRGGRVPRCFVESVTCGTRLQAAFRNLNHDHDEERTVRQATRQIDAMLLTERAESDGV